MKKGRNYDVYKGVWIAASKREWATWVKAGKRGSINQIVGVFGSGENRSWVMVSTGPSNRKNRAAGEWESLVLDIYEIDLVNPSYCRGSIEEIEAMHGQAVSKARAFIRIFVDRVPHYSENIEKATDPRYLAKTYDFAVDYFEEELEL
jgi:hypothetical protein